MSDSEFAKTKSLENEKKIKLLEIIFSTLYPKFKKYLSKQEIEILDKAFLQLGK